MSLEDGYNHLFDNDRVQNDAFVVTDEVDEEVVIRTGAARGNIDIERIQSVHKHSLKTGGREIQNKAQCSGKNARSLVSFLLLFQCLRSWRCDVEMNVACRCLTRVEAANAKVFGEASKVQMIRHAWLDVPEERILLELKLGSVRVEGRHGILVGLGIGLSGKDE